MEEVSTDVQGIDSIWILARSICDVQVSFNSIKNIRVASKQLKVESEATLFIFH